MIPGMEEPIRNVEFVRTTYATKHERDKETNDINGCLLSAVLGFLLAPLHRHAIVTCCSATLPREVLAEKFKNQDPSTFHLSYTDHNSHAEVAIKNHFSGITQVTNLGIVLSFKQECVCRRKHSWTYEMPQKLQTPFNTCVAYIPCYVHNQGKKKV